MNPYLVLHVSKDADDRTIRQAYLAAIRAAPPEKNPARFQEITTAYEKIKDAQSRCRHFLFDGDPGGDSPMEVVQKAARLAPPPQPLAREAMVNFLRDCAKP